MLRKPVNRLRKLIRRHVNSRGQHLVMRELWEACRDRFWEDNVPTRRQLLIEYIDELAAEEIAESRKAAGLVRLAPGAEGMIVKIQRPLVFPQGEQPKALVYNEDQSFYALMPFCQCEGLFLPPLAPAGTLKVYHEAELKDTELHIGERVEDQDW